MNWKRRPSCIWPYEKHMIEANRLYWADDSSGLQDKKRICVYHGWPYVKHLLYADIVAKGLQEREKCAIISVAITNNTDCKLSDELDDSFGIKKRIHLDPDNRQSRISDLRTYLAAQYYVFTTYGRKEKLFQAKYRGIAWGNHLHDAIVQENSIRTHGKQMDVFDVDRMTYFLYVRKVLSIIDLSFAILEKAKPDCVIAMEPLHLNALFTCVASKMGVEVISCELPIRDWVGIARIMPGKDILVSDLMKAQIEDFWKKYPAVESKDDNLFVFEPEKAAGQDLRKKLGLDPTKKNVFIMPHIITDSPRETCHHYVYHDYNEWFLDTLRIIGEIPNVNWIIKDHPVSATYVQDSYIRTVFEKNKTSNMYWCDKAVSGMDIKEIADCVITCVGDVALEYWAYGIPTITTSNAYYCDWGISYCAKTLAEYEDMLQHIERLDPPEQQSMQQARKVINTIKDMKRTADDLGRLFSGISEEHEDRSKRGDANLELMDFILCKQYTAFLATKGIKDSAIYCLDRLIDIP